MAARRKLMRRTPEGTVSELPVLEHLSADDAAYLRAMLGLAETGSMFQGRYVEAHVARVLGAQFPITGISTWDLFLPGERELRIEVKSTAVGGSFAVGDTDKPVDLWIFVMYDHASKTSRPHSFRYLVMAPRELAEFAGGRKSVKAAKLFDEPGVVLHAAALRAAVGAHQAKRCR